MMRIIFLSLMVLVSGVSTAAAADTQQNPVEISAATSLEWNRSDKTFIAKDKVVAKKDTAEIHADRLIARYTGDEGIDVTDLTAEGSVVIISPPYTAYGDRAVYDVKSGNAILTGTDLRITTETERLTAKDRIEYNATEDRLVAVGDAVAVKEDKTLTAKTLTAFFTKGADGKKTTQKITAEGPVVIKTAKETVTGDSGVYDVAGQSAVLTGHVVITQGDSRLEGTRVTVDMKTGISRLFAEDNKETDGRVTGVFYPKKKTTQP